MKHNLKYKVFLLILAIIFTLSPFRDIVLAQTSTEAQTLEQQRQELQSQLDDIEKQIAQYEKELGTVQSKKNTLANKLKTLKSQQAALKLKIQAINLRLKELERQLSLTRGKIKETTDKIYTLQDRLTLLVQNMHVLDRYSLIEMVMAANSFSDFYNQIYNYESLNQQLGILVSDLNDANQVLQGHKQDLDQQKQEQQNYMSIVSLQQAQLNSTIKDQNSLLAQTKGQEASYQEIIKATKKKAEEIRGRIYSLFGVTTQITFGEALQIANWVSSQTGVRVAFLLAILTQESNLGKNVGTCNRAGDPPSKSYQVVMKPSRDIQPFLQITKELGMNPDITPVSCPMRDKYGKQLGWGGAMGPAQFIPSTWMGWRDKVAAITGKTANPWDIRDAFIASGLKLKAGGAGTQAGEWAAAMIYFSGSTNTAYRFYGDNVVAIAKQYQNDIDDINKAN